MKILFVSNDLIAGNLALVLKKEGHNVKLFIEDVGRRRNFDNLIEKVDDWKKELDWVGKDGMIIFDDVGYGEEQEKLRQQGYVVFGGSRLGDKFESDREYGQNIFKKYGLGTVPLKDFDCIQEAIDYIKKHNCAWVIKQNNHKYSKVLNHVGSHPSGHDVISLLESNLDNEYLKSEKLSLHQKIEGVEIGVGRYFNGKDWVGPIEFNLEHTRLFPNDLGPLTSEMGTLAWYSDDESNKLYKETLEKLKPYLQEIDFRGDIEVNNIVNEKGIYALEATSRFGSPIVHLQTELQESPWGEFLYAIAKGEDYEMKYKKGFGLVTLVVVPPFPYGSEDTTNLLTGTNIFFDNVSEEEMKSIHFEEISMREGKGEKNYYISDNRGYVLYVTSVGDTVLESKNKTDELLKKILIPKMFYRQDIGLKFEREEHKKLKEWGYL